MDDSGPLVLGRVKWFDAQRRHGVVTDVGGTCHHFELPDRAHDVAEGELVTFNAAAGGEPVRVAKMGSRPHTGIH